VKLGQKNTVIKVKDNNEQVMELELIKEKAQVPPSDQDRNFKEAYTKDRDLRFRNLDQYIQQCFEGIFELLSPFAEVMEKVYGKKLLKKHSNKQLEDQFDRAVRRAKSQTANGDPNPTTEYIEQDSVEQCGLRSSYEVLLKNNQEQLDSSVFRCLEWLTRLNTIASMFFIHNTAATLNLTIGALVLSCRELGVPYLSKALCDMLTMLTVCSIGISVFRSFYDEKGTYLDSGYLDEYFVFEWFVCVFVNLLQLFTIVSLCALRRRVFPGAIGGRVANIDSFNKMQEELARRVDYDFNGNASMPDIDQIENYRV